jgi:hypothetical protein
LCRVRDSIIDSHEPPPQSLKANKSFTRIPRGRNKDVLDERRSSRMMRIENVKAIKKEKRRKRTREVGEG